MAKHRLGIVGFGGMGNWHRELIESGIENLEIAGMFDIKEERQEAARELGYRAYESLDALLADETVDMILISTPNDCHKPIAVKAMEAGKNVVSEKPVTLSSEDLLEMIDASKRTGKIFTVHQNRRWDEDFLTVKKLYDENALGDVFNIESRVHGSRGIPGDWRGKKEHGGGMMLDWGVHIIDQMLLMVKEKITSIYCKVNHVTNYEVDDGFTLILTFESGKTALLEVGTSNFIELPRWYMLGENGSVQIDDFLVHGKIVRITDWDKNDAVPVKTAAGLTKTMAPRTDDTIHTEPVVKVDSDIKDFYRNVMAAIEGREEQLIKHDELLRVMRVMETALRSAELNQVLPFEA
ncbi:Gfo/Idh/MocA family oxidoreductase [Phocea massiliensis]|uniref:Gfo/Idh/MocA family oxidoreductase n=1 Tax=Merdimmobilis hominis TaxID=2897707 RepID=A0A939BCA5_9FIRM|nr:Gfo/Idh/MocA family oxidoreductase [Merdimmobilis hominis]MBM6919914.1 Gfo/Idh/MocA family oxidoreductase [Merdimmobilis hominis]